MLQHPSDIIVGHPSPKLYLGDLSFHCIETEIANEFTKKGYSCHVKIAFDIAGKPRGYGFAYFKTIELATLARDEFQGIKFHGRRLRIHYAGRYIEDQTPMNSLTSPINSVYVRFHTDLNTTFDEACLESFFASCGSINDVCIKDMQKVRYDGLV
jgi:RNA recognition motif-containing protein